jgi:hypothetical protein
VTSSVRLASIRILVRIRLVEESDGIECPAGHFESSLALALGIGNPGDRHLPNGV